MAADGLCNCMHVDASEVTGVRLHAVSFAATGQVSRALQLSVQICSSVFRLQVCCLMSARAEECQCSDAALADLCSA